MRLARKLTLAVASTALVIYSMQWARGDEPVTNAAWTMEIIPATKIQPAPSAPVMMTNASGQTVAVDPGDYERVYQSIPFRRSEYRINPNYRHDSAMEILTGNARHQTIVEHEFEHRQPVVPNPAPARPSRVLTPFSGWNYWFGQPYHNGLGWW